jgi:hypothetical protein
MSEVKENKFEGLFIICYGLAGGFGGERNFEVIKVDTQEEADEWAFESACQEYESYAGMYGLRDLDQIMADEGIEDEDEAQQVFEEERESWLAYSAQPYSKEYENKVSGYNYYNPHKEITGDIED